MLSVIILTYNEELNLRPCLESLKGLASQVLVVDSGSQDRTVDIARQAGAEVIVHPFETQAKQFNWALDHLALSGDWVLRLDADEQLTPELAQELRVTLPGLGPDITGLYMKRRVFFLGRWIRHGGYYPTWLLRVWRKGYGRSEERAMDEHVALSRGRTMFLKNDIREENHKDLTTWIEKQNRYASREVFALSQSTDQEISPRLFGTPEARRRWLKYNVYLRVPSLLRAFLYFNYRYFLRLGFLDGRPGLIFHFLHGCWYRFLVDAKIYEAQLAKPQEPIKQSQGHTPG